jgi:DNA-binding response OmpR family regulator
MNMHPAPYVLVIEDDFILRQLVELTLLDAGYRVRTAEDGQAGLKEVADEAPCLILLDMKMPRMDGWQFARAYRAQWVDRSPIVVVTAAEDAQRRAADIGASGYLDKPFNVEDLLRVVAHYCRPAA